MPNKNTLTIKPNEPVENSWVPPPVPKGQSSKTPVIRDIRIFTKKNK